MRKLLIFFLLGIATTAFGQLPNTLTPADKVYGLSKFWQEVNYNFVYLDKVDRPKWDSTYKALITNVQKTENDYQYYRELQQFCALLKDGHTNVYMPQKKGFETMTSMFGDYRLFIQNIDNKAIIVRTNASKHAEIPVGSEVVEVNGLDTQSYIRRNVAPYISASTGYVLADWSTSSLLQGLPGDKYRVKIRKPTGRFMTLDLTHAQTTEKDVFPPFDKEPGLLEFKWYDNRVAYVGLNSFDNPKIDSLFITILPELYKAKALIIDLRNNGGGSTAVGTNILQFLTTDQLLYGARNSSRQHIPAFKAWGRFVSPADTVKNAWSKKALLSYQDRLFYTFDYAPDTLKLTTPKVVVPTAVLIGHGTASAAEDFLIYAANQKHFTKIGSNSFGSTGQPFVFDLPGGATARVCTKKDTYPDGTEFVGYGIKPDIAVQMKLADYLNKRDPVLTTALEYLKKKTK
jgi:C-terminal processing protease CtpA/Prc